MRCKEYKNGWSAYFNPLPNGWYETYVRNARGDIHDKHRLDNYRDAMEYYKCFSLIAKAA